MQTEFNKIQSLPALVDVIFNTVIIKIDEISSLLNELLIDLTNVCNQPAWDAGFLNNNNNIPEYEMKFTNYLTEKLHPENGLNITNTAALQQYMDDYVRDNMTRQEINFPKQSVYNDKPVVIKDKPDKTIQYNNEVNQNNINLNQMQLDLAQ